jgi:zinc-ribbon domain
MPESCTCGAQLPPDARFCHKCGKPQRDEPEARLLAEESVPVTIAAPLVQAAAQVPLGFRNPIALRVGLLAAALVCLTMMIPVVQYLFILWWLGAGYLSVWIYKRRTGQRLNIRGGARMGWITGLLTCGLLTLLFTFLMLAIQQAGGLEALKSGLKDFAVQQSRVDEAIKVLQNPLAILRSLLEMFVILTLTCMAGGALGAKILSKD